MTEVSTSNELRRKHPLAKCEECPLYEDSIFVPSFGPDKADVCLVGEAPGLNEAQQGEPFVGASGQLLNQVLDHSGVQRKNVFITNTCLCRPKDNATPSAKAIAACHDRLLVELKERSPKVVVTLGAVATGAILPHGGKITSARVGPPKETELLPGVRIVPTFHPAAALYNAGAFPDIVTDFGKITGALNGTFSTGNWSVPEVRVLNPVDSAAWLVSILNNKQLTDVAIDIEVAVDKDADLGQADRFSYLSIGLAYDAGSAVVLDQSACNDGEVHRLLGAVLDSKRIICQNGKFDLAGLFKLSPTGAMRALYFDTMLAHYALDERRGIHSLEQLAVEYLGAPMWKGEIDRYVTKQDGYAAVPKDILYRYNAYDVVNTFRLRDVLRGELEAQNLTGLHDFLVRSSPTLMRMEINGVGVDLAYNDALEDVTTERMGNHLARLQEILEDKTYNPNSPQQVMRALKDQFKVSRIKDTQADTIELVQELAAKKGNMALYEFCESHLAFKKEAKSYGTYVKGIRSRTFDKGDGPRVFPSFLLHGTVTGRLSSRNPNLQNITRGSVLRGQFVPTSPDNVFIQADYRQAELRVVCRLARDAYLRDVLSDSSRDIHGEVATRFYGESWTKEQRVRAKAVVFGLTYGREAASIAAEYRMSKFEAQKYINQWFHMIPDTVRWLSELETSILEGQDLVSSFTGRHRRFWLITKQNKISIMKEGRAFLPQADASDYTLESANRLSRMGYQDKLRIPVHDALVLEVPRSEAEEASQEVARVMSEVAEEAVEGYIPFPVDIKIGTNWGALD